MKNNSINEHSLFAQNERLKAANQQLRGALVLLKEELDKGKSIVPTGLYHECINVTLKEST